jgi:hypothetical protein
MLTRAALAAFFVTVVACVLVLAVATPPGSAKTLDTGSPTGEQVGPADPHHVPPPHHDPHDLLPPAQPPIEQPPVDEPEDQQPGDDQQPAADERADHHEQTPPEHHVGPPEEPEEPEEPDCEDFPFLTEFGEFPWWCFIDWYPEAPGFPGIPRVN